MAPIRDLLDDVIDSVRKGNTAEVEEPGVDVSARSSGRHPVSALTGAIAKFAGLEPDLVKRSECPTCSDR